MRLLFVSHSFPPRDRPLASIGGMQRVAVELSDALPAHVLVSRLVLRSAWRWHHLQCALWLGPTMVRIWRKVRRGEVDAVLFSSMVTAALSPFVRRAAARRGVVLAAIAHGKDVTQKGPYQGLVVRRTLRALDAVLPVSRATGAACALRGMPESRIHVIPNGVNVKRFAMREHQGSASNTLLLCSVGRLVRRKGFEWFIRTVMPRLPACVHYHVGGDGPERQRIMQAIRHARVADRVRLLGRLSDAALQRLYAQADLLVVPNIPVPGDMEGFGIVMLEAGACGLPAVAARLEGIRDVISEGVNGHLVESGDADGFVHIITHLLDNPSTLRSLRIQARQHTLALYRWDAIAARFVRTLSSLRSYRMDAALPSHPPKNAAAP